MSHHRSSIAAISLLLLSFPQSARTQRAADAQSVNVPVTALRFYRNDDGMMFADAWGDPKVGPHSNFIRIPGNTASPLHTHSSDYYGVVISGVVANERPSADPDRPLMPGSYWYQKGKEAHVTKCISPTECLIFVTSTGPFDFIVVPGSVKRGSKY
jgi:hypothetical protein